MMGDAFFCQRCELPRAELVISETDDAIVSALVCLNPRCGLVTVLSQTSKSFQSDSDTPEN